jgi:hypothetical protein
MLLILTKDRLLGYATNSARSCVDQKLQRAKTSKADISASRPLRVNAGLVLAAWHQGFFDLIQSKCAAIEYSRCALHCAIDSDCSSVGCGTGVGRK